MWRYHRDLPIEYPQFHAVFAAKTTSESNRIGIIVGDDDLERRVVPVGTNVLGTIFWHQTVSWKIVLWRHQYAHR